jgi:branched-chain amino acid transport system ATP-binding protein
MLSIEGMSAGYNQLQVLYAVSLDVETGKTVIIVGPNGAGKSTLLKVIIGLLKSTSGTIYFDGQQIDGKEAQEIVDLEISLVPEGGQLFPNLTVFDNLKVGTYVKRARRHFKERLEEVFGVFPILKDRKTQLAGSLSGGERQMLAIARSLMSKPKLVMLDEPSSGLAPLVVANVFKTIRQIKSEGYSILMSEQNARKALELADYAYLIESGRVQFQGNKEDFIQNPDIKRAYLGI